MPLLLAKRTAANVDYTSSSRFEKSNLSVIFSFRKLKQGSNDTSSVNNAQAHHVCLQIIQWCKWYLMEKYFFMDSNPTTFDSAVDF